MLSSLQQLTIRATLSESSRQQLIAWLLANKTGDTRLRAGVPQGWRVGDKTGAGDRGTTNDVGVVWPPNRQPLFVAVYLTESKAAPEQRNSTIAAVARAVAVALGQ
jgi:beta-lactamase class A